LKIDDIKSIDSDSMSEVYDRWPQIARENFSANFSKVDIKNIDHVVFAGMGGSGTIGDLFASILSKTDIHVSVIKGYLLPKTVDSNTFNSRLGCPVHYMWGWNNPSFYIILVTIRINKYCFNGHF